jgi:integrase
MAIYERTNKNGTSYQVKLRDKYEDWYQSFTTPDKAEAERFHAELLRLKAKGVRANLGGPSTGDATVTADTRFEDFQTAWAAECRGSVGKGWQKSQDQMTRDYIMPELKGMCLADIRPRHIAGLLQAVTKKGRSPGTVNHVYTLLHDMFTDAIEHFECQMPSNPVLMKHKLKKRVTAKNFLHPDETRTLLEHCRGHYLAPAIWVGIYTGMRPCEIQTLEWRNVRWEYKDILIVSSFNRKEWRHQDHPKQKDAGKVPMPDLLIEFLKSNPGRGSKFVCPSKRGFRLNYTYFNDGLKELCLAAGVKRITPHELRHSATEMYVENGASETDCQRLLNHKSASSTSTYMHRTNDRLQSIASNVGRPSLTLVRGNISDVPEGKERAS